MGLHIVILFMALALPTIANATVETLHFQGDLKIVTLSGAGCDEMDHQKTSIPLDLALRIEKNETGEHYDGYYSGLNIQVGHFTGDNLAHLQLYYPDDSANTPQGHTLELIVDGTTLQGEVREKHLEATDKGCDFDLARLTLSHVASGEKSVVILTRLRKLFTSEAEYSLGYKKYEEGIIAGSIPYLETAVRLLEEIDGFSSESIISPAFYLSMSYCVTGRFVEGYKLQERIFSIPMEENKRQELQHSTLINLYYEQVRRLNDEGQSNKSIILIENAIARYPELLDLLAILIEIYEEQGSVEKVCLQLEQAFSLHPEETKLNEALGLCLAKLGNTFFELDNPDKSLTFLRRAFELDPSSKDIWGTLLMAYSAIEKPGETIKLIDSQKTNIIGKLGQNEYDERLASIYNEEARLAEKRVEYQKVEGLYRKAVALNPDNIGYIFSLARFIHKRGRYLESVHFLKERQGHCKNFECRKTFDEYLQKEALVEKIVRKIN